MNSIKKYINDSRLLLSASLIIYLLLSLAIVFYGRGSFISYMLIFLPVICFGFYFVSVGVIILIYALCKNNKNLIGLSIDNFVLTGFAVALVVPVHLSTYVNKKDCENAKDYCEKLVPILDATKAKTGRYPADISKLLKKEELPAYLRRNLTYKSEGDSFSIVFHDKATIFAEWKFSGAEREWKFENPD